MILVTLTSIKTLKLLDLLQIKTHNAYLKKKGKILLSKLRPGVLHKCIYTDIRSISLNILTILLIIKCRVLVCICNFVWTCVIVGN